MPRGQKIPLNQKSKRSSRVQTKDNIPQRLPNVRVDVQMIENASLCISLNFLDEPTPIRVRRSLLLSRRSNFHERKQNIRFIGILVGNFTVSNMFLNSSERHCWERSACIEFIAMFAMARESEANAVLHPLEAAP